MSQGMTFGNVVETKVIGYYENSYWVSFLEYDIGQVLAKRATRSVASKI